MGVAAVVCCLLKLSRDLLAQVPRERQTAREREREQREQRERDRARTRARERERARERVSDKNRQSLSLSLALSLSRALSGQYSQKWAIDSDKLSSVLWLSGSAQGEEVNLFFPPFFSCGGVCFSPFGFVLGYLWACVYCSCGSTASRKA